MGQILQTVVSHLWLLGVAVWALVAWSIARQPRVKIWLQDRAEQRLLSHDFNPLLYVDMAGVQLDTPQGPQRIPHVLVSPYGVYVLNVLHMNGDIEGEARHAHWALTHARKIQKFPNPLTENELRCQAVQKLLQLPPEQVHSVVLFMGRCALLSHVPANVTQPGTLVAFVRRHLREVFTPEQMQGFIDRLSRLRQPSGSARAHRAVGVLASEESSQPRARKNSRRPATQVKAGRVTNSAIAGAVKAASRSPRATVAASAGPRASNTTVASQDHHHGSALTPSAARQPDAVGGRPGEASFARQALPKFALSSVKEVDIALSLFPEESQLSSAELAELGLPPASMDLMTVPAPLTETPLATKAQDGAEQHSIRIAKPVAQLRSVCPQCGGALRLIAITHGPLAGSAFQRCTQVDRCDYAQPIAKKPKQPRKPTSVGVSDQVA